MSKGIITGIVTIHLVATLWHGSAHSQLAIGLPPEKNAFVFVVILIAPIVSAVLIWTRYFRIALLLFFLSMIGAFLFGAYHHYVMVSPDHIGHLPAGSPESHSQFISSAAAIALIELGGSLFGAFSLGLAKRHQERHQH